MITDNPEVRASRWGWYRRDVIAQLQQERDSAISDFQAFLEHHRATEQQMDAQAQQIRELTKSLSQCRCLGSKPVGGI